MRCSECDEKIKSYYNFCKRCGMPLEDEDFREDKKAAVRGRRRAASGMITAVFLLFLIGIGSAVFLVYRMSVRAEGSTDNSAAELSGEDTLPPITETTTTVTTTVTVTTTAELTTTTVTETTAVTTSAEPEHIVLPESVLRQIVAGKGNIALWNYADYDGDGLKEAFALTVMGEVLFTHTVDNVYFIDAYGTLTQLWNPTAQSYSKSADGNCRSCEGKCFFWFDYSGITLVNNTLVYGVRDGQPYKLDVCGDLNGFYQDENGTFYTTETGFNLSRGIHSTYYELLYDPVAQQFRKGGKLSASAEPSSQPQDDRQDTAPDLTQDIPMVLN